MPLSSFYEIHSIRFRPRESGVLSSDASTVGLSFTHLHGMINHWLHLILYFWGGFVLFSATATYQVLLSTILLYFYWCFLEFPIPKSQIRQPAKKTTWLHIGSYSLKVLDSCAWLFGVNGRFLCCWGHYMNYTDWIFSRILRLDIQSHML